MKRRVVAVLIGCALALVAGAGQALAGGWGVATVDSAPQEFVAGETHTVEFRVLQHGVHPLTSGESTMHFVNATTGQVLDVPAQPDATTGTHSVQVTLPDDGTWSWTITSVFGEQDLGVLQVASAGGGASAWTSPVTRLTLTLATAIVAGLLIAQAIHFRRDSAVEPLRQPATGAAGGD